MKDRATEEKRRIGPGGLRKLHYIYARELDGSYSLIARELLQAYHVFALSQRESVDDPEDIPSFDEWLCDPDAGVMVQMSSGELH